MINSLIIGFAYPLPSAGLEEYVSKVHGYFKKYNVFHSGRGGNYLYCNLDKAYKQGVDSAKMIIENEK